MAMSKETEEWLSALEREGGMSGASVLELKQHFSHSKADEFVKGSVLRQSDYSRSMAEVQRLKSEAEAERQQLTAAEEATRKYQTELVQWQQGAEPAFHKANKEREIAERKAANAVARLKSRAAELGLDETELLRDLDIPASASVVPPAGGGNMDTSQFITRESLQKTAREVALLEGVVNDLADTHFDLFGKRLNRTELIKAATTSGKSVEQYWNETFKVEEKRAELANVAVEKRISEAVAAKEAELRSQIPNAMLPRPDDVFSRHKIFSNESLMKTSREEQGRESGRPNGVSAAIAAFNSGAHRQGR